MLRSPCRNRGSATHLLCPLRALIAQSLVLQRKSKTRAFAPDRPPSRRSAPPLPSRAPGPPGQTLSPSLSGAPFRSLRLVGHATHPLSLPPGFANPPTRLRDIRSAPAFKVGTLILSGGHSFGRGGAPSPRNPLTPLARPGSIHPLSGAPLSNLPLAHPLRFAPFRLPQGRLPSHSVSRRPSVATSGPRLFLDLLPTFAWKTLFGCLRETSCSRRPQGLPRPGHAEIQLIGQDSFKASINCVLRLNTPERCTITPR